MTIDRGRYVLGGLLGLAALAVVFVVWALPGRVLEPTGPHEVATSTWILVDEGREDALIDGGGPRRIPVQAWYPADGARGPVVVFVHGSQGRREGYLTLLRELASRGYVAVAADHPPIALQPNFPDRSAPPTSSRWRELLAGAASDPQGFVEDPTFREAARTVEQDLALVLDELSSRLDGVSTDEVALAGHSFGGGVALGACGREPRCAAVISLDGPALAEPEVPRVAAPLLVVTAGRTLDHPAQSELFDVLPETWASATGPVHVYEAPDAGHLDLSDLGLLARPVVLRAVMGASQIGYGDPEATLRAVAAVTVTFLDRYLQHRDEADPDALAARSSVLEIQESRR